MDQEQFRKIRKKIIRAALWFAGLASAMVILLWAIASYFEKDIEAYFLSKLNQELNTRVEIKEVSFSLLKNFPSASVSLKNVSADHSKPFSVVS
jgi:hypothetical protein